MSADKFIGKPELSPASRKIDSPFALKTQRVPASVTEAPPETDGAIPATSSAFAVEQHTIPPTWIGGGATRRGSTPVPEEPGRPRRFTPAPVIAPPLPEQAAVPEPVVTPALAQIGKRGMGAGLIIGVVAAALVSAGAGWYFLSEGTAPEVRKTEISAPVASVPTQEVAIDPPDIVDERGEAGEAKRQAEALIALARERAIVGQVDEGLAVAYAGAGAAQRRFDTGDLRAARDLWRTAAAGAGAVAVKIARMRHEAGLGEVPAKVLSDYAPAEWSRVAGLVGDAEQLATSDPQVACEAYAKATLALNGVREAAVRQITALAEKAVASKDTGMAVYFYEQELRLAPGNGAAQAYLFRNKFKPGQVLNTPTGLTMAYVPPGNFSQGTPAGEPGRDADETQRAVTITRGFHLGVSEVTQGQWDRVMGANDAENRLLGARLKHEFLGANKPMILVTWEDAREFCRRLGEREQARYRLPTEAEWEYSCRAGTTTAFHVGQGLGLREANIDDGSSRAVGAPVAAGTGGRANAWGLSDLHGNVWEWCADWSAPYPALTVTDPTGPADDKIGRPDLAMKVVRGGSWNGGPNEARSGNRWEYSPVVVTSYIGFRVVREVDFSSQP